MDNFAITVSSDSMKLQGGHGEVTFTVTNNGSRALRARAEILPSQPESSSWISIAREPERHFPPGAVEQFLVKVNVPPGGPAGDYSYVLRVADLADPNERYSEGPAVGFKVAPVSMPEPAAPRPFPWWIFAVIGASFFILVGGIVYWAVHDPGVPLVVGESQEDAEQILRSARLTAIVTDVDSSREQAGKVISQNPEAGETTPENKEVSIAVGVRYFRLQLKHGGNYIDAHFCTPEVHLNPNSDWEEGACQLWREVPTGDGWFRLQLKHDGQYLNVVNCSAEVQLSPLSDEQSACQLWREVPTGDGWFRLQLKQSQHYLDADHCTDRLNMNPGSTWEDGACQLWKRVDREP